MGNVLIRLGVSAMAWVACVIVLLAGWMLHGSPGHWGTLAAILAIVAWWLKPHTDDVDRVLDALRHDAKAART